MESERDDRTKQRQRLLSVAAHVFEARTIVKEAELQAGTSTKTS